VPQILKKVLHEAPRRLGDVNPQVTPFFEEVVHALLAKKPADRFADATTLFKVLEEGEKSEWWKARAKEIRAVLHRPIRRVRVPRDTALYGRDAEIAKLRALWDRAKTGHGQVLLLEGEAGIGKTRLVDELVARLRQDGDDVDFLFGSYPPGGAATASGAFSTAYREHFGDEGLEDALKAALPQTPLLVPAFAALLRGDAVPSGAEPLTKDSLQTVFVHATRSIAAERPTIVLIDDLQFAPDEGRGLFAALAMALSANRVLLVGATRPGLTEEWVANVERQANASRLVLPRLGPKDLATLLREAFRSERLAQTLAYDIAAKSDGNPFFVFEIIRGLREGALIAQQQDGTWAQTQVIEEIQIPSSVMDLIQARIAGLTDDERNLVEVASCCGLEFDPLLVGEVLGMGRIPALQRLGKLEKSRRLVRSAGMRFVFDHNQIQEALYAGLSPPLRQEYHAALGETLEAREKAADRDPKTLDGAVAVQLCEHLLEGGRGQRGVRYLDAALDHLAKGYVNAGAISLCGRALALPGVLVGAERARLLNRHADLLGRLGRTADEGAAIDEALALADRAGDADLVAEVRLRRSMHFESMSRYAEAEAEARKVAESAAAAGDGVREAGALSNASFALFRMGRLDEASRVAERALALARSAGNGLAEAHALSSLGVVASGFGRAEEARGHLEAAARIQRTIGSRERESSIQINLSIVLWNLGRFREAFEVEQRVIQSYRELGARRSETLGLVNRSETLALFGDLAAARENADGGRALARDTGARRLEGYAHFQLGCIAAHGGDFTTADRDFEASTAILREIEAKGLVAEVLTAWGRSFVRRGRADDARRLLSEALALAEKAGAPGETALASALLAVLPGGDVEGAKRRFAELGPRMGFVRRMEADFLLWRATSDRAHLESAHRALSALRADVPDEYRESIVANVPLHREIVAAAKEAGL
jgi:tetratricopeptide (TPR) repeat protein